MVEGLRAFVEDLFPAPAGMIPATHGNGAEIFPFPRTRGDDPFGRVFGADETGFSPHPRG